VLTFAGPGADEGREFLHGPVAAQMTDREHREWTQQINNLEFLEKPLSMRAMTRALDKHFGTAGTGGGASHV
jgi:hypothetical protein